MARTHILSYLFALLALLACVAFADTTATVRNATPCVASGTISYKSAVFCGGSDGDFFKDIARGAVFANSGKEKECTVSGVVGSLVCPGGQRVACKGTTQSKNSYQFVGSAAGCAIE